MLTKIKFTSTYIKSKKRNKKQQLEKIERKSLF